MLPLHMPLVFGSSFLGLLVGGWVGRKVFGKGGGLLMATLLGVAPALIGYALAARHLLHF